jgi:hypothetical protein
MVPNHNHFTKQMRTRLETTAIGLGLVRLLQNAGRTEEARAILASLENGFQCAAPESDKASQKPCQPNRCKGVSRKFSFVALSASRELVY